MTDEGAADAAEVDPGALCPAHAVPATYVCARCGTYACPRCHEGADGGEALCTGCYERALREAVPWDRMRELGVVSAFLKTTRAATFAPTAFFRAPVPRHGSFAYLAYGVLAYSLGPLLLMLVYLALMSVVWFGGLDEVASGGPEGEASAWALALGLCMGLGMTLVWIPIAGTIGIVVDAAITHLVLVATGPVARSFEATMRAVSYANAPYVLFLIPCCGWVLAPFWMMAVEVIALRETHRVGTSRAALAVLGYRVLLYGGVFLLYAALIGAAMLEANPAR